MHAAAAVSAAVSRRASRFVSICGNTSSWEGGQTALLLAASMLTFSEVAERVRLMALQVKKKTFGLMEFFLVSSVLGELPADLPQAPAGAA
jgi:hypothetical protein